MMEVALVGCGHMGGLHAQTVAKFPGARLAAVVDIRPERAEQLAQLTGAATAREVPTEVDAVIIATPTSTHVEVARPLLHRGQWCLVEKPLADSPAETCLLEDQRLVVGHIERYNPAVRALGPVRPRYVEARRVSTPVSRGMDVDVVFDLMIHDLDLVLHWSGGSRAEVVDAVGVVGPSGVWDVASVRLRVGADLTASLMASRVSTARQRFVHVFEPGRSVRLDLLKGQAFADGEMLGHDDDSDALTAQWRAFTDMVVGRVPPTPSGREATDTLRLAQQIVQSMRSKT